MKKLFFIMGLESSGSALVANIIGHVLNVIEFNQEEWGGKCWGGKSIIKKESLTLIHRSLPYHRPQKWVDLNDVIREYHDHERFFILTTRDQRITELSKVRRFGGNMKSAAEDSIKAAKIITTVLKSQEKSLIWSYETFMLLGLDYLKILYNFIGVSSKYIPKLRDANPNYLK